MRDVVKIRGKIVFDPDDVTNKHKKQSSWKYIAMIMFDDDFCEYYSWFFKKRFNLILERPLRGPHLTIFNDSFKDLSNGFEKSKELVECEWKSLKERWEGKSIEFYLNLNPDTNSISKKEIDNWKETGEKIDLENLPNEDYNMHWWLIVPHDLRSDLQSIRSEIGLGKPFFGMHVTIGRVLDSRNIEYENQTTMDKSKGMNIKEMRKYHSRYLHWLKLTKRI